MHHYHYRATDTTGRIEQGTFQAANENDLQTALSKRRLELIACTAQWLSPLASPVGNVKLLEVAHWCRQMAYMLQAGVTLVDALNDGAGDVSLSKTMKARIHAIKTQVSIGHSLSEACLSSGGWLNLAFCAVLYAAEQSGALAAGFARLTDMYRGQAELQGMIRKSLRYPTFLCALAVGVMVFMMIGVVPALAAFLQSLHQSLPLATRLLIALSNNFLLIGAIGIVFVTVCFVSLRVTRRYSARVRLLTDRIWLYLPILGGVAQDAQRAQFFSSLSGLLYARMKFLDALRHAAPSFTNAYCVAQIECVCRAVETGYPLSSAMHVFVDPARCRMIAVAEAGHNLPQAVDDLAQFYASRTSEKLSALLKFIEPTLTLLVGGMLAWIVLAVLGPIYGSLGHVQAGY